MRQGCVWHKTIMSVIVALVAIQLLLLSGCATAPHEIVSAVTSESVRLVGRTCSIDDVTWLAQSGSAVEFHATGAHVTVELVGDKNVENEHDLQPRFAVLVDGDVVVDDTLGEASRTVEVMSEDSDRTAVVEVMLLSEAKRGAVGVRSVTVEAKGDATVSPTKQKDLHIEFIGDSITCGYGVEGTSASTTFKTTEENYMKSYAYLAARELDADYSAVCYSGYGIVSGWSADGTRNADMLLPPLYDVVSSSLDVPWDHASHPYDIVVINLGTNDFTYTGTDTARMQEYAAGYRAFLSHVRTVHPESYIVCTIGTMGAHELYPYLDQAVSDFKESTDDTRITSYLAEEIDYEGDGVGARPSQCHITAKERR